MKQTEQKTIKGVVIMTKIYDNDYRKRVESSTLRELLEFPENERKPNKSSHFLENLNI